MSNRLIVRDRPRRLGGLSRKFDVVDAEVAATPEEPAPVDVPPTPEPAEVLPPDSRPDMSEAAAAALGGKVAEALPYLRPGESIVVTRTHSGHWTTSVTPTPPAASNVVNVTT